MNNPKTRNENIVIQEANAELLIYDLKSNQAFCLNETSAIIYQLCDGKRTVAEITRQFNHIQKQSFSEDVVWLALNDFKRDNLLEESESFTINFNGLSRRQIIKKIGFASMIALPFVSSIVAPSGAMAASGGLLANNAACTNNSACQSGNCFNNTKCCVPGSNGVSPNMQAFGGCVPNASRCDISATDCCSGSIRSEVANCSFGVSCFCN